MSKNKKEYGNYIKEAHVRKDVDLHNEVIEKLKVLAGKKGWKLKPFMEYVLNKKSETVKTK